MIFDVVKGSVNNEDVIYLRFREPGDQSKDINTRFESVTLRLTGKDAEALVKELSGVLSAFRIEPAQ